MEQQRRKEAYKQAQKQVAKANALYREEAHNSYIREAKQLEGRLSALNDRVEADCYDGGDYVHERYAKEYADLKLKLEVCLERAKVQKKLRDNYRRRFKLL